MSSKKMALLMAVVLCIELSSSGIIPLSNAQGYRALKSYHGTYLSGNQDGTLKLASNILDWEKWKWVWIENMDFVWVSFHGTYLSGNQDGTVKLAREPREWERWTKVEKDGNTYWRSYHGTYLSGEMSREVTLKTVPDTWERWV